MPTLSMLLMAHIALLILAATDFTAVTWMWGDHAWSLNYFQYTHQTGWGHSYESPYGLGQVLCHIAAYGAGTVAFLLAWVRAKAWVGWPGAVLCGVGLASFSIEGSHWLWAHNLSWIASFPGVMAILWVILIVELARSKGVRS